MTQRSEKSHRCRRRVSDPKIRAPARRVLGGIRPVVAADLYRERNARVNAQLLDGPLARFASRADVDASVGAFLKGTAGRLRRQRSPGSPRKIVCVWADVSSSPMCSHDGRGAHAWARRVENALIDVLESSGKLLAVRLAPNGSSLLHRVGGGCLCLRLVCETCRREKKNRNRGERHVLVSVPARLRPSLPIQLLMRVRSALTAPAPYPRAEKK